MKIAVINSTTLPVRFGSYGFEQNIADLSLSLAKNHDVVLFAPTGSLIDQVKVIFTPNSYGLVSRADELFVFKYYQHLLIDMDYIIDASATNITTEQIYHYERLEQNRVVWLRNGLSFENPRYPASSFYKGITLSKTAQQKAKEAYHSDNIEYIYPGINENLYNYTGNENRSYYLYLSRPHPSKGIFDFIRLAKRNPDKQFIMAFDMTFKDHKVYGQQAIEMIKNIPNIQYIPINGSQKNKIDLFRNAISLIIPLRPDYIEAFGMVFIESLMTGTPVITAHGSTPQEYLSNDVAIFCKDDSDYDNAINMIPDFIGRQCRDYAVRTFTTDKWADRILKVRGDSI